MKTEELPVSEVPRWQFLPLTERQANVVVVNESYPSECIQFRSLLNHAQMRFRVEGAHFISQKQKQNVPTRQHATLNPSPESLNQGSDESENLQYPKRSDDDCQRGPDESSAQQGPASQLIQAPVASQAPPSRTRKQDEETHSSGLAFVSSVDARSPQDLTSSSKETEGEQGIAKGKWKRDALDDIIDEAKATSHLPLDFTESPDDENAVDTETDSSGSDEPTQKLPKSQTTEHGENTDWTKGFACMQQFEPAENDKSPNSGTIDILQQMLDYYTRNADQWRIMAYRRAIAALRKQKQKIATKAQARAIPGVGKRLADKIEEIVLTNRLRRLENANNSPEDLIVQKFLGVYGAGLSRASRWVAQGYRSLADLLEKAPLTKQQRIGVERYNDFAQRIPRKEVEAHGAIVRQAVQNVDKDMQVIVAGSYRRGALTCGDVDCLITKPGSTLDQIRTVMLELVVPQLFNDGFLKANLVLSAYQDGSKWHGASALPGTDLWRRIDLLFVPDAEIGAALVYFTGNDIFNRSMRLLARKKGMCLNQRGLYTDVLRDGHVKLNSGRLVEGRDERRIFAVLGVPWRPPEHRIC
ncbi:unnamed protein product [Penicillium olsonii]|nr:unnamed protein product [Penicillium olsonii]